MSDKKNRILSYQLASILEAKDLEQVAGGVSAVTTVGSQRIVDTRGGDATIVFDNYDHE